MRRWAYMGIPHTGGTYSVFKNLRAGLLSHGIELRWVGVGAVQARRLQDGTFDGERQFGTVVAPMEADDAKQGQALLEFFGGGGYEGVFVNALCGRVATNFVRYLTCDIRRIMIVHNITVGTYAAARAIRDCVHATVGVSPRIVADLVKRHGFAAQHTISIANSIQVGRFTTITRTARSASVRVSFLGRIENGAKGCLLLPKIISQVHRHGVDARWTIAGDGPDLPKLQRQCQGLSNVRFLGRVPYERVPQVLAEADVYIFPSRYEGFGISLVEAMAAGCVPVASAIRGVTDHIVEHGTTGYLFPIGNGNEAAAQIAHLASHRDRMREMAGVARQDACERFSIETVSRQYAAWIEATLAAPPLLREALDMRQWTYPRGLKAGFRTCLPERIKLRLRSLRETARMQFD